MSVEKIKKDFNEIVETVDEKFGEKYSSRNPGLIQHLLDKVQQEADRRTTLDIHKSSNEHSVYGTCKG